MAKDSKRNGAHQPKGQWCRAEKRLALYLRDGFKCLWCESDLTGFKAENITLDHLIPKSAGGSNAPVNLVTACRSCNSARQDKGWLEFGDAKAVKRIRLTIMRALPLSQAKLIIAGKVAHPRDENK